MKVQNWKRITKTDYPDMPEWFSDIADALNRQVERLTLLAQNNITFGDNFAEPPRTIEMADDTTVSIELQALKRNPIGVLVLNPGFYEYFDFTWQMSPNAPLTVDCKIKFTNAPATSPEVTLLFVGAND